MSMYCDENNDGVVDECEVHACVLTAENDWRMAECPGYEHLKCDCKFHCPECYTCADLTEKARELFE